MTSATNSRSEFPVYKLHQPDDSHKIQKLPEPTGNYPFHLNIGSLVSKPRPDKLIFHMVGDTGSMRNPDFQKLVVSEMTRQFKDAARPEFLYHLGDLVYNFGEACEYDRQFFSPYNDYPAPILAIPGNHDSDINPENPIPYRSLDAFRAVFCSREQRENTFSKLNKRKTGIQPNIYWTLNTSLATIIGLYTNVPKYGYVNQAQKAWFIGELQRSRMNNPDKALIVCLHHSPYSADTNHGSSIPMINFLEDAFNAAGVKPDIVFSAHVHNYQRFEKSHVDGTQTTYIVAGGGGYDELHPIVLENDQKFTSKLGVFDGVKLVSYCDDRHGFLKISLEKVRNGLTLTGAYYSVLAEQSEVVVEPTIADTFKLQIDLPRNGLA